MSKLEWVRTDGGPEDTHWKSFRAHAGSKGQFEVRVEYQTSGGYEWTIDQRLAESHAPDADKAKEAAETWLQIILDTKD